MKFLLLLLLPFSCLAQVSIETTALVGSSAALPFWFTHNQSGRYATTGNAQSLTEAWLHHTAPWPGKLTLSYGADLGLLATNQQVDAKIIEAYAGLSGKVFGLKAGAFEEEEQMGGLSSSNGNIVRSLNYRPYPRVRLSTTGFQPIPRTHKKLLVAAEYDEAILYGERITNHPHLHHKSLQLMWANSPSLRFTVGIDHYVFWGGHSETLGDLPHSLTDYIHYVTGQAGSDNFTTIEQQNVAGNQLGAYLFSAEKDFESFRLRLQASHPFDDGSGMGFENLRDNLYALCWHNNAQQPLLQELVIEYLYTKHQSGDRTNESGIPGEHQRGVDNYFNHGIYASGFTYLEQSMGTPLFEPLAYNARGVVAGVANNRVSAFHLGAKGCLSPSLTWKTLLTYTRNFGTYIHPYLSLRPQFYSMARLGWHSPRLPLTLDALMGADIGRLLSDKYGVGGSVRWMF